MKYIGLFALIAAPLFGQTAGMITTVAGNGTAGYNGDNVPATAAPLNDPVFVAFDAAGNLYIADQKNNRIRKVDPNGVITTFAGNGVAAFTGDGPATANSINQPTGVAFDAFGNMLLADTNNVRLRRVTPDGTMITIAGTGQNGASGDGGPAINATFFCLVRAVGDRNGNIFIADQCNHRVRKITPGGTVSTFAGTGAQGFNGDNIPATSAMLNNPTAVAVDPAGNVYFSDQFNHRIRKVDTNGVITTIAGTGTAGYNGDNIAATSAQVNYPGGLIVDPAGNIFFADDVNYRVREISAADQKIRTVAGNGVAGFADNVPGPSGQINGAFGLALDGKGNLFFADAENNRVRKVSGVAAPLAAPSILTDGSGVINGGSYQTGNIVSGSWVAIKGTGFTTKTGDWSNFDFSKGTLPTTLNGVQVLFNGQPGAMWYLIDGSPQQINVQAPANLSGNVTVQVVRDGVAGNSVTSTATEAAPGIFSYTLDGGTTFYPSAVFLDGTLLGDPAVAASARKAKAGDKIVLFANSLAPSTAGVVSVSGSTHPVTVTIGSTTFPADFSGLVAPGEFQINITVPDLGGAGNFPIKLNIDGKSSQSGVLFAYTN
jgi:uncharacterized protein (TIGR03437 family)